MHCTPAWVKEQNTVPPNIYIYIKLQQTVLSSREVTISMHECSYLRMGVRKAIISEGFMRMKSKIYKHICKHIKNRKNNEKEFQSHSKVADLCYEK